MFYGNDVAGKVFLEKRGLYYRLTCRCQVAADRVFRLYAVTAGNRNNLGVVMPEGDGFALCKMIPAKHLEKGNVKFVLSAGKEWEEGIFVPICPEEPFAYIDRLKNAFLASEQGKTGVRIRKIPEAY